MNITIHLASALRRFVNGQPSVLVSASSVADAIRALSQAHPALAENILTKDGEVRSFIRVFVNKKDIRFIDTVALQLSEADTITLMPAIAGG
jgi:molybdopterin converting factor small subunit